MTEEIQQQVLTSTQRVTDRQLIIARDPLDMLKYAREKAWWNLERQCERLDMKFDKAKVRATWEYRLELVTEVDPERLKRKEVLKEWSEQRVPRLLAPDVRMGEIWLDMNRDLVPGLTKRTGVVIGARSAFPALRGYTGTLLIVEPGPRPGTETPWRDFYRVVAEIFLWERFTTWTEILP